MSLLLRYGGLPPNLTGWTSWISWGSPIEKPSRLSVVRSLTSGREPLGPRLRGSHRERRAIEAGRGWRDLAPSWKAEERAFGRRRAGALLYR